MAFPDPKSRGGRGDAEYWTNWIIFLRSELPDWFDEKNEISRYWLTDGLELFAGVRGPGEAFSRAPEVWGTHAYVVVEQTGGMDY